MIKTTKQLFHYLETIAATAPAHRCLVVFMAPAPAPCVLTSSFFSTSFTTSSSTSFPSNAGSSDLPSPFCPKNPSESRTNLSPPLTDKLTDKNWPPPNLPRRHTPRTNSFWREATNLTAEAAGFAIEMEETMELGTEESRKRPPATKTVGSSSEKGIQEGMRASRNQISSGGIAKAESKRQEG